MNIHPEKILELIELTCLNLDIKKLKPDSSLSKLGLDSMDKASLILEIEETYGISIPDSNFEKLDSLNEILIYLKQHIS